MIKKFDKFSSWILWLMLLVGLIVCLMTFTGINRLLVAPLVANEAPEPADVIIVLGGGVVTDLRILPWSVQERVQKGIELFQAGYAPQVILTGGLVKDQAYTESQIMREYAELLGLPEDAIIEENTARDTHENATNSLAIMGQRDWDTALLVTSDYHSARACRVFKKAGVSVTCLASEMSPGYANNYFRKFSEGISIGRDYAAVIYYWMRGYI